MTLGLDLPIGINKSGGMRVINGDDNDRKDIMTALSDCDNDNAYQQDLGIDDLIFDINSDSAKMKARKSIRGIFKEFELQDRFKIFEDTIEWGKDGGELTLSFKYHNLETDEEKAFRKTLTY